MADQGERYIYQRFPYVILDDTPSSSSGSDSDPSEVSADASQAATPVPQTPPAPVPAPAPVPTPIPSPPRVPAWDGLRRMRGQARKTTGLPPRRQMAPRDEPDTIHEVGESSQQAEFRAQLRQVTLDLQGTRLESQESRATKEDTRTTVLEILTSHLLLMEQVNALDAGTQAWRAMIEERMRRTVIQGMIAAFWQQVLVMRGVVMGVLEGMSLEVRLLCVAIVLVIIAMVLDRVWYFLR
ncbi:hypothetical protein E3N88_23639 [Mikania micrantha]|uniref:Uncharacterized protein n=1 Tax=Mikania micrantha TaxID=192012 RepID=A0A5N6NGH7_9ASTR|nr:hypothetical protein E3N88_23639 [Mikania micrantha]